MKVYHVTTEKKLKRYKETGAILPPVRYWTTEHAAYRWMKKVNRSIILEFEEPKRSFPLPIKGGAKWTDCLVRKWRVKPIGDGSGLENRRAISLGGSIPPLSALKNGEQYEDR